MHLELLLKIAVSFKVFHIQIFTKAFSQSGKDEWHLWKAYLYYVLTLVDNNNRTRDLQSAVFFNFLEGQGRGSVKDLPRPFFLKSTLFTNSAPELSLIVL